MDLLGVSVTSHGSTIGNIAKDLVQLQTVQEGSAGTGDGLQAIETTLGGNDFSQTNWGLSDLDLDAILQGFLLDRDLHFPMPLGT